MAGLASVALTAGEFGAALTAFTAAAVVLVGLLFSAAFAVAGAQERTVERIRIHAVAVKRWGGWILTGVGTWLIVLAVFADFFVELFPV